jgi:hypothetical protein
LHNSRTHIVSARSEHAVVTSIFSFPTVVVLGDLPENQPRG